MFKLHFIVIPWFKQKNRFPSKAQLNYNHPLQYSKPSCPDTVPSAILHLLFIT